MRKRNRCLGVFVVVLFVLNFIIPPGVFAQVQQDGEMEKKCAATKTGTETDEQPERHVLSTLSRLVQQAQQAQQQGQRQPKV